MAINEEFQESGMTLEELQVQLTDIELSLAMEYFNIEHIEYEAEMEAINYYKDYNSNMSLVTEQFEVIKEGVISKIGEGMKKVYDRIIDMLKNIWESITKAFKWIKDKFTNKIEQIKKVAEPKSDYPDLYDVTKVAKVCSGIINGVAAWSNGIVGVTNKYFKDDSFKESFDKEYLADRKDSLLRLSFTCTKVVPYPGFVEATSMQDYKQLVKDKVLDEKNKGPVGDILRHMTKALDFGSNMAKETAHALTEFKMNATKCKNNSMLIKDTNGKTVNTMACAVFSACGTIVNAIYEAVTVVLNQYLNLKI